MKLVYSHPVRLTIVSSLSVNNDNYGNDKGKHILTKGTMRVENKRKKFK